jgi:glycosyltransferase involved in cell wall biosynthesis
MTVSTTHLVLIPTYNTGAKLVPVVREVLQHWQPVVVVVDGSTDEGATEMRALAEGEPQLTVLVLPENRGKGAAVLEGAAWAVERGFTHALVMDADGQHPAGSIAEFMGVSRRRPEAAVLGVPVFGPEVPRERLYCRKLSTGMTWLEVMGPGVRDALFGFRIYPLQPMLAVLGPRRGGRRYDFETEAMVRLMWSGVPTVNVRAPVRYFTRAQGGVSHFNYLRDNVLLFSVHARLMIELIFLRWPELLAHRRRWRCEDRARFTEISTTPSHD